MSLVGFESAPRYREFLYKLISEDLEFPPPGFIIESDRPEWSFLKDEILWAGQPITIAAVALNASFYQAFNPVGSGRIVVVDRFFAGAAAIRNFSIAITTTVRGATGAGFAVARDTRWTSPIVPAGAMVARDSVVITSGTQLPPFGTDVPIALIATHLAANEEIAFGPVILAPGTGVVLSNSVVNEQCTLAMAGYSRQARPEELVP